MRVDFATWAGAGLALLTAAPSPAAAQVPNEEATQLARQLASYEARIQQRGFNRIGGPHSGLLRSGRSLFLDFGLETGGEYAMIGVCDLSCSDLDLRLYDQNNAAITEDIAPDDYPVVTSRPRWTGAFRLEVMMYNCRDPGGCYFAVNIYGR